MATETATAAPKFEVSFGPRVKSVRHVLNGRASKYPWKDMVAPAKDDEGNDIFAQFFVPERSVKSIAGIAYNAAKRMKAKFSLRSAAIEDTNEAGETITVKGVLVQRVE